MYDHAAWKQNVPLHIKYSTAAWNNTESTGAILCMIHANLKVYFLNNHSVLKLAHRKET